MKKILITTMASAVAACAMAETLVFDVTMKVKTTVAKTGAIKAACIVSNGTATVTYRKQGTINVQGLIWGCSCDSLVGPLTYTAPSADGCCFWNVTDSEALKGACIFWPVLHRIDNKMKKAEGVMELSAEGWYLLCAGFGRVDDSAFPAGLLKNMNGYFAGWRLAPSWKKVTYGAPCTFCESGTADIEELVSAEAWALCSCAMPTNLTAAFGSWKIKYNKNLSKKLNDVTAITSVYTFPSYVSAMMSAVEAAPAPAAPEAASATNTNDTATGTNTNDTATATNDTATVTNDTETVTSPSTNDTETVTSPSTNATESVTSP